MDMCIDTADDPSTCGKNLVKFGPITLEFCRRLCMGRATPFHTFSFNHIRQMAPIVDADVKSFVSAGRLCTGRATRWALPRNYFSPYFNGDSVDE